MKKKTHNDLVSKLRPVNTFKGEKWYLTGEGVIAQPCTRLSRAKLYMTNTSSGSSHDSPAWQWRLKFLVSYGPFRLGATHGRQAPHHPSGQQLRALQTGIQ